jgi:hypothetical protein
VDVQHNFIVPHVVFNANQSTQIMLQNGMIRTVKTDCICHLVCRMGRRLRTATTLLDVHLVAALVQAGAEATAADAHGRTPLHTLAAAANTDAAVEKAGPILRILLARGAKVCADLQRV